MGMKANRKFVEEDEAVSAVIGVILMVAITVAIAATVYYYVTVLTGGTTGASAPTLAWSTDAANNQITITKCSPSDTAYAADATTANIIFRNTTGEIEYVFDALNTTDTETGLETGVVLAGQTISNFADATTYSVVWVPTNEVLGSFSV
jgi:flagellin-like protein